MHDAAAENARALLERARTLAAESASHIVLPLLVEDRGRWFDRAYLIDDAGAIAGTYDKVHPTLGERERLHIVAGEGAVVVPTRLGRVALTICYDVYFPAFFAALARMEPDVLILPSLQRSEHELASEAMVKVRAMDAATYLVRSSYGTERDGVWRAGQMFGGSCIVHPDGTILGNAGHYEGVALALVTLPFTWRRQRCGGYPPWPVRSFLLEDERRDVYEQL